MTTARIPDVHADAAFAIGQMHLDNAKPCQDYALAGALEGVPPSAGPLHWAAVSDGCSTGGLTDVGARLWVHAARRALQTQGVALLEGLSTLKAGLLPAAAEMLAAFHPDDGLATLLLAASDGRCARVAAFGDGAVALLRRDGSLQVWHVAYQGNAPRYLQYETPHPAGETRLDAWVALVGDSLVSVTTSHYDSQGRCVEEGAARFPAATYPGLWLSWDDVSDFRALLVVTDGVDSFESAATSQSVRELLAVKNAAGLFMHRRMGAMARGWKKDAARMPRDDLGAAALWFSEPESTT